MGFGVREKGKVVVFSEEIGLVLKVCQEESITFNLISGAKKQHLRCEGWRPYCVYGGLNCNGVRF